MVSEPAHDLAIPLRSWNDELTGSGAGDRLDGWCARLGASCDVDPGAIWEWAFTERVSTGLFLLQLGDPDGQAHLDVAEVLLARVTRRGEGPGRAPLP
jgi:streptomycin 6-kinase